MELEMGTIITGKVTGITKFGAFVSLGPGKSGLVHISEIANSYVNDVREFLTEGQEVEVKVIGIDDAGRINLSIKQAQAPAPAVVSANLRSSTEGTFQTRENRVNAPKVPDDSFEDKLKRFMQDSDSKISCIKQYADKRNSKRRNRG